MSPKSDLILKETANVVYDFMFDVGGQCLGANNKKCLVFLMLLISKNQQKWFFFFNIFLVNIVYCNL